MNKNKLPHIGTLLIALSIVGLLTVLVIFNAQIANTQRRITDLDRMSLPEGFSKR